MARKNHKKKSTKLPLHKRLWHKFVNLPRLVQLPFFLLALTFPFVVYGVSVQIEKNKFKRYSFTITQTTRDITTMLGSGEIHTKEFCDRTNLKYQKGELTCQVLALVTAKTTPNTLSVIKDALINNEWSIDESHNSKLSLSAHYKNEPCYTGVIKKTNSQITHIEVYCSASAKQPYYKLLND